MSADVIFAPLAAGQGTERSFETLQDRLVKLMKSIKTIEAANDHLESTFRPKRDKNFTRLPVCGFNARLPIKGFKLDGLFCEQDVRTVRNDLAISLNKRKFQIFPRAEDGNLRRKKVAVELRFNG